MANRGLAPGGWRDTLPFACSNCLARLSENGRLISSRGYCWHHNPTECGIETTGVVVLLNGVRRMRRSLLTLALCCSLSQAALAQEQDHAPWLNAFGRFWGIGYSAGYHAQTNSRLGFHHYSPDHNVVPQPPRGLHANPNLYAGGAHPAAAYYPPSMATNYGPTPAPQPMSTQSQNLVPPPPQSRPVDPPPNWLKQYIKPNGEKSSGEAENVRADELLNDNSPSDRKGVMLAPSPDDSTTGISITPVQPTIQIGGRPVISVLQQ